MQQLTRQLSRLVLGWILLWFTLACLGAEGLRPNFILIVADDMGYGDIGPFGSKKNRTPNLDKMASEGMKLTSFYAAPVCTPSRAQILTGCYAKRVSLPNVIFPACPIGLNTNELTIAKLLKQRGYATMAIGKWHVGDAQEFLPLNHGFDHYFGLPYSNDMGGEGKTKAGKKDKRPPLPLVRDNEVVEVLAPRDQDRLTERYTEEALKFIRENKARPFFLYFPHTAVHVPIHPGDKFRGGSGQGFYTDWVEELDWSVGQILHGVRELGLAERTLVFFTSDNGPWLTQGTNGGVAGPLRGGKGGTYEGGVREPTIAWWPGKVPAGRSCDTVAANFDFLPTFAKLSGGTVPAERKIDGKDISPLIFGESKVSPHEAVYYFSGNALQAVRSGPWKLAVARQSESMGRPANTNAAGRIQPFAPTLYNLESDIGERKDVAGQNPEVVKWLKGLIAKMDADLGTNKPGPGVRPPGRVKKPTGLWLPGKMPAFVGEGPKALDALQIGDLLEKDEAPEVADKALTISCWVEGGEGVILAHGGVTYGYALHLAKGKLVFTVREERARTVVSADQLPAGALSIEARLARDGAIALSVNGKVVAQGKAPGVISRQPQENFCLGFDDQNPVGDYQGAGRFSGKISGLKITAE